MPNVTMRVEGLQETAKMLLEAPNDIVARGFLKALSAAGNVVADYLEAATPVKSEDTGGLLDRGVLRESVMMTVEIDSKFRGGQAKVGFGKNGFVAAWVEYGHKIVDRNGNVLGMVPEHPFIRRAADESRQKAVDAFVNSLKSTIAAEFPQGRRVA